MHKEKYTNRNVREWLFQTQNAKDIRGDDRYTKEETEGYKQDKM